MTEEQSNNDLNDDLEALAAELAAEQGKSSSGDADSSDSDTAAAAPDSASKPQSTATADTSSSDQPSPPEPIVLTPDGKEPTNLSRILSMKVPVIVKVAEKKMAVKDILKLSLGSLIQFERDAYQHIDLMVNNSTIGLGQPIKIGENFGLKITQIGDITETIKSLGSANPSP